jgi:hypothetical protein
MRDVFPDGMANHHDRRRDMDGVHVKDYDFNVSMNDQTFLWHNCHNSQDPN